MNNQSLQYMRAELSALSMNNWAKFASADEVIEEIAKFASAEDLTDEQIIYLLKTAGFADSLGSAFGAVKSMGQKAVSGISNAAGAASKSVGRVLQAPATRRLADAGKTLGPSAPGMNAANLLATPNAALPILPRPAGMSGTPVLPAPKPQGYRPSAGPQGGMLPLPKPQYPQGAVMPPAPAARPNITASNNGRGIFLESGGQAAVKPRAGGRDFAFGAVKPPPSGDSNVLPFQPQQQLQNAA